MFAGNPSLRGQKDQINYSLDRQREFKKCAASLEHFATHLKVMTLDSGLQPLVPREYQKELWRYLTCEKTNPGKNNLAVRYPRRAGKTTALAVYILWFCMFHKSKRVLYIADQKQNADTMHTMILLMLENLPLYLQIGLTKMNAKEICFVSGSELSILATGKNTGRSKGVNLLILDEFGHVEYNIADALLRAILPTVSSAQDPRNGRIVMLSTPLQNNKGKINHFNKYYRNAVMGRNSYTPFSLSWNEVPGYTEEFKQRTIADNGMAFWLQEYECQVEDETAGTFIEKSVLDAIEVHPPTKHNARYTERIYEEFDTNYKYLIGVDVGEGTAGDPSVILIYKTDAELSFFKQVYVFEDNTLSTRNFANQIVAAHALYPNSIAMLESNEWGHGVIAYLVTKGETDWLCYEPNKVTTDGTPIYGIKLTSQNRPQKLGYLRDAFDDTKITITDENTLIQLKSFGPVKSNRTDKVTIRSMVREIHDDLVMGTVWALSIPEHPLWEKLRTDSIKRQAIVIDTQEAAVGVPICGQTGRSGMTLNGRNVNPFGQYDPWGRVNPEYQKDPSVMMFGLSTSMLKYRTPC